MRSLIVGIVLRQADENGPDELQTDSAATKSWIPFAYIASHDLKGAPLRGIHNYANFLMEDYGDSLTEDGVGPSCAPWYG